MTRVQRIIHALRSQAIGVVALFVALGGTGYAAISIPAGSVGSRQLRNDAVTSRKIANGAIAPAKLNGRAFGGYVLYWAQISATGQVIASRPRGAHTTSWNANPAFNGIGFGGPVTWNESIPAGCFALAGASEFPAASSSPAYASAQIHPGSASVANVIVNPSTPVAVNVAVICPAG